MSYDQIKVRIRKYWSLMANIATKIDETEGYEMWKLGIMTLLYRSMKRWNANFALNYDCKPTLEKDMNYDQTL